MKTICTLFVVFLAFPLFYAEIPQQIHIAYAGSDLIGKLPNGYSRNF